VESNLKRTGIAMAALFIAGLGVGPAQAGGVVTTSLFLPLQGTVVQPTDPCRENVPLGGMVHVVSIVPPSPFTPPSPIKLHFNMAGVLGTGETSGNTYIATGAAQVDIVPPSPIVPPNPIVPPSPIFQLEGTGSCAGQAQLPVSFNLLFDQSGHLLPSSSASFGQCSVDHPCQ